MKIYTIIAGVNGAGKSSFTGSLKYQRSDMGVIIDTDKITAEQYSGDEYEGGKAAIAKIQACLQLLTRARRVPRMFLFARGIL